MQIIKLRLAAFTLLLSAYYAVGRSLPIRRAIKCNGHEELCNRSYGNTTFLGSHDSFAFSRSPFALSRTQEVDIPTQLKLGVRMLQAQGRMNGKTLHFCHTSCSLFDGGPVEDYLKKVKTFLDNNHNEVLTFIFTNPENASISKIWEPAFLNSGIAQYLYTPPTPLPNRTTWPTLSYLIQTNKRLVTFIDKNPSTDRGIGGSLLPQFDLVWEDPYSSTDDTFPCSVDRSTGTLKPEQKLNMINHNLNAMILPGVLMSDVLNAHRINGVDSIVKHASGCAKFAAGNAPNFVMVDYVHLGEGVKAVDRLNGFKS
ncbi:PLC-like phosphodiesterase [Cyathus striatus]|nr:PLC-like phosphodiesterase [Cyathus striatus]